MEETVLANLIYNEKYARKVIPYLNNELFYEQDEKVLFRLIDEYIDKYNALPTKETLYIDLENVEDIGQVTFEQARDKIAQLAIDEQTKIDWLLNATEKFVQDRAIQNALRKSITILDQNSELTRAAIPQILQEALQVSFDTQVGHDFIEDADDRYERYHLLEDKVRFNLDFFNRITGGGLPPKTLSCLMASTGVGKSLAMCSMAAANLMDQKNVLYITLEMAEERIAQRIDANLLDVTMDELLELTKEQYDKKIEAVRRSTKGKLIVKEYPTATAGSGHFRHLLNELRIKKNFIPNIIYIDYLNLCTSSRIKAGAAVNSYTYIKAIAEEIRGLAVEQVVPIITATQANRDAIGSSDIDLDNTSDSMGLPMTLDFMVALIATEELDDLGQIMVKQLKNRLGDPGINRRFVVGINKAKMRLFDVDISEQQDILDGPVMDNTEFGQQDNDRNKKFDRSKFRGFS